MKRPAAAHEGWILHDLSALRLLAAHRCISREFEFTCIEGRTSGIHVAMQACHLQVLVAPQR
jgi:hypothetical protein